MFDLPPRTAAGYAHPAYAAALSHLGPVRELAACGGTLLQRRIPESECADAMGPYPLFACARWDALAQDIAALQGELVSVTLVTDPFGQWTPELLQAAFPELARPYKQHLVTDLSRPVAEHLSKHHRRKLSYASAQGVEVRACDAAGRWVAEWCRLYANLIRRHAISGPAAFPPQSLAAQLAVPGARLVRAEHAGEVVAMSAWYRVGEVAVYHLGASSDAGYALGASYPLMYGALELFRTEGARWAHLGAGAGARPERSDDGLTRFKRGWATGSRHAWLCGRVLDRDAYDRLASGRCGDDWFPAYRRGSIA